MFTDLNRRSDGCRFSHLGELCPGRGSEDINACYRCLSADTIAMTPCELQMNRVCVKHFKYDWCVFLLRIDRTLLAHLNVSDKNVKDEMIWLEHFVRYHNLFWQIGVVWSITSWVKGNIFQKFPRIILMKLFNFSCWPTCRW